LLFCGFRKLVEKTSWREAMKRAKVILVFFISFLLLNYTYTIFAEESIYKELKEVKVEEPKLNLSNVESVEKTLKLSFSITNDVILRGEDIYYYTYIQKEKNEDVFTPNVIPKLSLDMLTPLDGFIIGIEGYFPLLYREDKYISETGETIEGLKRYYYVSYNLKYSFHNRAGVWGIKYKEMKNLYTAITKEKVFSFVYKYDKLSYFIPKISFSFINSLDINNYYLTIGIEKEFILLVSPKIGTISINPEIILGITLYSGYDIDNEAKEHWFNTTLNIPLFWEVSENIKLFLKPEFTYRFFKDFNKYQESNYEGTEETLIEKPKLKIVAEIGVKMLF
jgi:hypothetical protein